MGDTVGRCDGGLYKIGLTNVDGTDGIREDSSFDAVVFGGVADVEVIVLR